jgi:tripartite-type tricarboxylate transporter receptor subunit TctC
MLRQQSQWQYREGNVRIIRWLGGLAAILIVAASTLPVRAQDFPNRPIRIVIAFPPGGPTDFVGRLITEKMKAVLGQSVLIENKPGANGTLGADNVAKSAPDGYTLFLTTVGAVTVSPHVFKNVPYDSLRDFAPVAEVVSNTTVLVVTPKFGIKTAKELVDLAKQQPGAVTFASTGIGGTPHLALEEFAAAAGVKFLHVPYRGAAPAINDLLSQQVQMTFLDLPVILPQIKAGNLHPIALGTKARSPLAPDVPTTAEVGMPEVLADNWYGMVAPAATPKDVIAKLNKITTEAMSDPNVKDKLADQGLTLVPQTPEQFRAHIVSETAKWAKVIKDSGVPTNK